MKLLQELRCLMFQKGIRRWTILHFFSNKKGETNKNLIEQIILEKYNQYYRLAYSYVHNEGDAGDIVQNGAYKALRNSHTLKKA